MRRIAYHLCKAKTMVTTNKENVHAAAIKSCRFTSTTFFDAFVFVFLVRRCFPVIEDEQDENIENWRPLKAQKRKGFIIWSVSF